MLVNMSNVESIETESTKIYNQIQKFLLSKETKSQKRKSDKTRIAYEKDIKDFFRIMRGKSINELSLHDLNITFDDFEDFINYLLNCGNYSNSTIDRKITASKMLLKYLHSKKIDNQNIVEDISYFDEIGSLPDESEAHGILTVDEVKEMAELASKEREKGHIKKLFFLLGLDTALRKEEIASLKWSDFHIENNTVIINGIGKGNYKFKKEISVEFYQTLKTLDKGQVKVFDISVDTIDKSFDRIRTKMNFPKQRNIVFHSIRKASITHFYQMTKDPYATMLFGNHKNFNTTVKYIQEENHGALGAVSLSDSLNMELYKEVSHEDLLEALSKLDNSYLIRLK